MGGALLPLDIWKGKTTYYFPSLQGVYWHTLKFLRNTQSWITNLLKNDDVEIGSG